MTIDTTTTPTQGESIAKVLEYAQEKVLGCDVNRIEIEGIFTGKLGLALYCEVLYHHTGEGGYLKKIEEVLDNVVDRLMKASVLDESFQGQVEMVSDMAFENCLKMIDGNKFDYFYGANGLLFFLEQVGAYEYCGQIVDRVYEHGVSNGFRYYNDTEDIYTEGINFGFAHRLYSLY